MPQVLPNENQHATINVSMNLKLVVSFLMVNNVFSFKPGCGIKNTKFTDFFYTKTTEIASGIPVNKYLQTV